MRVPPATLDKKMKVGDLVEIQVGKQKGTRGIIRAIGALPNVNNSMNEFHEKDQHLWSEWGIKWDGKLLAYPKGELTWITQKDVVLIQSADEKIVRKEFRNIELEEE